MIETVDEIAEARALVEQRQRELRSAELALSDWKSNRHTGGFPVKSLDLGTMRTRDAFAVDTSSFESRENMLQSAIHGCSVRLADAVSNLKKLRLSKIDGTKVRVQLFHCETCDGDTLVSATLASGTVFATLGAWAGVLLDSYVFYRNKPHDRVFARINRLLLD